MKRNFTKLMLLGLALAGMLLSCARQEVIDNPNYDAEEASVTTQLVLNISTQPFQKTKQDAAVSQAENTSAFRGIGDAFLLPVIQDDNGQILSADMDATKVIDLSDVLSGSGAATHKRRVMEVQLPLKTNTLLFYARAPQGDIADYDLENDYEGMYMNTYDFFGLLDNYSIGQSKGSANFRLGIRMANTTEHPDLVDKFYDAETLLMSILNVIMNMGVVADNGTHEAITGNYPFSATPGTFDGTAATFSYPEFHWSDYANNDGTSPVETSHTLYSLELKLRSLYRQMTTIKGDEGELRAASGQAIMRTVQDLWTVINEVRCATPACPAEAVAKYFAQQVSDELSNYFTTSSLQNDGSEVVVSGFKNTSAIINTMVGSELSAGSIAKWWPAADVTSGTYTTLKPTTAKMTALSGRVGSDNNILKDFPFNFNLPRGATHMVYDTDHQVFYYPDSFNTSSMGTAGSYNATNYYYPAELLYFGNSAVRVSDVDKVVSEYAPENAWMDGNSWDSDWKSGATDGFVKSTTRAVAMEREINYGIALLETKVQYGVATLEDNRHAVIKSFADLGTTISDETDTNGKYLDEPNQEIEITDDLFELTGIIIGGQSQNVGWDYLPYYEVDNNGDLTDNMVYGFLYDKAITPAARVIPGTANTPSAPTYTMVFDNFKWASQDADGYFTPDTQETVSVALEFRNNGDDFYGNHNLIRSGGYFYLIGSLNPAGKGAGIEFNRDDHVIPPYTATGESTETVRVFIQDHKTAVTFTLGQTSLQHAYLTVPDLRSSSLSLGLDVDLNWEAGPVFDNVPLGD